MKTIVRWAASAALLISITWAVRASSWDAYAAVASALVVFLGTFVRGRRAAAQTQHVEGGSVGVQAGHDVNIRDVNVEK